MLSFIILILLLLLLLFLSNLFILYFFAWCISEDIINPFGIFLSYLDFFNLNELGLFIVGRSIISILLSCISDLLWLFLEFLFFILLYSSFLWGGSDNLSSWHNVEIFFQRWCSWENICNWRRNFYSEWLCQTWSDLSLLWRRLW